jgi:TatD DNase family protein
MLFDTHAHLDFPALLEDLETVRNTAQELGVTRVVCIGASRGLESNYRALEIARANSDWVRCTAGIHPHDADMVTPNIVATIREHFSSLPEVVGIGETGLDYHYDKADRANQNWAFREFLKLANEVKKPVIIHSRDAEEDTLQALRETGTTSGILHCFTGSRKMAETLVTEFDFYISFSGIVTFKNGTELLEIAAQVVPENRLLVETDSPYLAPIPYRGKTNQPGYVRYTAEAIARARGMSLEDLAAITSENARRVYHWD